MQRILLVSVVALFVSSTAMEAQIKPQSRIIIIRELVAEYGALKVPLPRGEKGLILKAEGEVDNDSLTKEISQNGTALPPKILAQITQIEFHDKEILFEINGGGKRKLKWYEHIEIGMGTRTTPITTDPNPKNPTGSTITLVFPGRVPDLTVEEVKQHLEPVLDFDVHSPILMPSRPIPPEFQKAIEDKQAAIGMDRDMVLAALGPPDRKVRETKEGVEQEDWIYGTPPMKVIFVTFEGDEVVDVQEYVGGVRGATMPEPEEPPR